MLLTEARTTYLHIERFDLDVSPLIRMSFFDALQADQYTLDLYLPLQC